jgi:hypothetical protein
MRQMPTPGMPHRADLWAKALEAQLRGRVGIDRPSGRRYYDFNNMLGMILMWKWPGCRFLVPV